MNALVLLERRLADRRATRRDGRRATDERPTMTIVEACRVLGIPTVGGNGRLDEKDVRP